MTPRPSDLAGELALQLASADDSCIDGVVTDALGSLANAHHADRSYVTMFHADGTFETSHEWTAPGVVPHRAAIQSLHVSQFPFSSGLSRAGKVFHASSIDDLPPEASAERESFGSFGVRAVLEVPIQVGDELLGLVGFNQLSSTHEWNDEIITTLAAVGKAIGVALTRRAANERVRQALAAAERANRAKDDLIAAASHELRTPLHAILGFAELLSLDGAQNEALDQIRANGTRLVTMIDDLLELGRIAATVDEPGAAAPLSALLDQVVVNLRSVAAVRDITIAIEPHDPDHDEAVLVRAHQVLHCVASAALDAAGPEGTVIARVITRGQLRVEFESRGPAHHQPAGLALAFARSLVNPMDGRIDVTEGTDAARITIYCGSAAKP